MFAKSTLERKWINLFFSKTASIDPIIENFF